MYENPPLERLQIWEYLGTLDRECGKIQQIGWDFLGILIDLIYLLLVENLYSQSGHSCTRRRVHAG
jgi:hypothetical protein